MNYRLIIKDRATQDLRQLANYILVNGNAQIAVKFLNSAELTFEQLLKTLSMGKITQLVVSRLGDIRQWRIKDFKDYLILNMNPNYKIVKVPYSIKLLTRFNT